ncbi:MAG: hypothetical protein ACJ8G3_19115 [Burkholderiaceae bacterium]
MHAVVVPKPGMQASEEEWRTHCGALIAGYTYPKKMEARSAMPLSAACMVGKV